jgi:anti-sigma regulatory factor (Ser/Thr protein kinase)
MNDPRYSDRFDSSFVDRRSSHPNSQAEVDDPFQTQCAFILGNDCTLIPPMVRYLEDALVRAGVCDRRGSIHAGAALEEALLNALYHGNLEAPSELRERDAHAYARLVQRRRMQSPFRDRRIHLAATICPSVAVFVVRDQGRGFDPLEIADPAEPDNLLRESGRGILYMRAFMDEVTFNEVGNMVTLIKRRAPAAA